jgi:hypothetical protein
MDEDTIDEAAAGIKPYPFTSDWKTRVDRSSAEWRAYLEAEKWVRRYFVTSERVSRLAARRQFDDYCERIEAVCSEHTLGQIAALRRNFLLVGLNEGDRLREEARGLV